MLINKRQAGQPQGAFKLRSELGFDSFILPGVGADLVRGSPVVFTGAGGVENGPSGKIFKTIVGSASGILAAADSSTLLSTQGCTVVLAGKSSGGETGQFGVNSDSPSYGVRLGGHVPLPSDGFVYFDFGGYTIGSSRLVATGLSFSDRDVWVFTSGARGMEIWQNGILRASNSANPTRLSNTAGWGIGSNGAFYMSWGGGVWYALGYSRKQMPKGTCAALSRDLWGTAFVQRRRGLIATLAAAARRRIVMWS